MAANYMRHESDLTERKAAALAENGTDTLRCWNSEKLGIKGIVIGILLLI